MYSCKISSEMQDVLHEIQETARRSWPLTSTLDVAWPSPHNESRRCEQGGSHVTASVFAALEALWDPNLTRTYQSQSQSQSQLQHVAAFIPRAVYEKDCDEWIRAPQTADGVGRGIVHLACIVTDPSVHVLRDAERIPHVREYVLAADERLAMIRSMRPRSRRRTFKPLHEMDDAQILADEDALEAISLTTGARLMIDDGGGVGKLSRPVDDDRCAWFVCDRQTGTWSARIFGMSSLTSETVDVQRSAFHAAMCCGSNAWQDQKYAQIVSACRRSGILQPSRATRDAMISHINTVIGCE